MTTTAFVHDDGTEFTWDDDVPVAVSRPVPPPPSAQRTSIPAFSCRPGATTPLEFKLAIGCYPGGPVETAQRAADARSTRRQDRYGR